MRENPWPQHPSGWTWLELLARSAGVVAEGAYTVLQMAALVCERKSEEYDSAARMWADGAREIERLTGGEHG